MMTEEFERDCSKLSLPEQQRVQKILRQLQEQGADIGKPLSGLTFFREKKFEGKRVYYLVYRNLAVILMLAISDKKAQQATINRILVDIAEYQQYVLKEITKN